MTTMICVPSDIIVPDNEANLSCHFIYEGKVGVPCESGYCHLPLPFVNRPRWLHQNLAKTGKVELHLSPSW